MVNGLRRKSAPRPSTRLVQPRCIALYGLRIRHDRDAGLLSEGGIRQTLPKAIGRPGCYRFVVIRHPSSSRLSDREAGLAQCTSQPHHPLRQQRYQVANLLSLLGALSFDCVRKVVSVWDRYRLEWPHRRRSRRSRLYAAALPTSHVWRTRCRRRAVGGRAVCQDCPLCPH